MKKILILRFSSIGDIVLTTPVIRILKQQVPGAQIHYATKNSFRSILENNLYVDKLHLLSDNLDQFIQELKNEQFDFVIDLHNSLRSRLIRFKLGVPAAGFNKLNIRKWLLVNLKINKLPEVHIVERYLATTLKLGVQNDGKGLDYFIQAEDEVDLQSLPITHQNGYIAFAIGAQHYTKRLPSERIIELCAIIKKPIILLGGIEDAAAGEIIQQYFSQPLNDSQQPTTKIFNACGKYNLNQSASLVKQADMVFTHDTGLMHIAAAFQKKIVSIWGNTIPEFGMYPYLTDFEVLENKSIHCRPCSKIGYKQCPQGHFKCMREIDFSGVPQLLGDI